MPKTKIMFFCWGYKSLIKHKSGKITIEVGRIEVSYYSRPKTDISFASHSNLQELRKNICKAANKQTNNVVLQVIESKFY